MKQVQGHVPSAPCSIDGAIVRDHIETQKVLPCDVAERCFRWGNIWKKTNKTHPLWFLVNVSGKKGWFKFNGFGESKLKKRGA